MLDLEAIKRRCEAATPPPWVNTGGRFPKINGGPKGGCDVATLFFADGNDGDFMAHAREDVPALVAEVARLQGVAKRLEVLKAELDQIYAGGKHADLSQFSCGVAAGIQQAVLWALEPESWAEPISTIGLPK